MNHHFSVVGSSALALSAVLALSMSMPANALGGFAAGHAGGGGGGFGGAFPAGGGGAFGGFGPFGGGAAFGIPGSAMPFGSASFPILGGGGISTSATSNGLSGQAAMNNLNTFLESEHNFGFNGQYGGFGWLYGYGGGYGQYLPDIPVYAPPSKSAGQAFAPASTDSAINGQGGIQEYFWGRAAARVIKHRKTHKK